jgi:hypothetical protein
VFGTAIIGLTSYDSALRNSGLEVVGNIHENKNLLK